MAAAFPPFDWHEMKRLEYALSTLAWLIALTIAGTSLFATFHFTHVVPFSD